MLENCFSPYSVFCVELSPKVVFIYWFSSSFLVIDIWRTCFYVVNWSFLGFSFLQFCARVLVDFMIMRLYCWHTTERRIVSNKIKKDRGSSFWTITIQNDFFCFAWETMNDAIMKNCFNRWRPCWLPDKAHPFSIFHSQNIPSCYFIPSWHLFFFRLHFIIKTLKEHDNCILFCFISLYFTILHWMSKH